MALLDEAPWRGKIYSDGWTAGSGGDAAVIEPATGAELGRTGIAGPADVARAAQRAAAAQPAWAATPHRERSAILRRAADVWLANARPGRVGHRGPVRRVGQPGGVHRHPVGHDPR